ncbi:MAG: methylmalonyl Co-A mutase-associated GTPase MeaB [Bacteroidetes bacterium SW_9_63_38]|nr:MAG: methylmalonyl Co-A mutase-associated GTPase MeaB [Bacteroidetes bacterium SW_9_63_38]
MPLSPDAADDSSHEDTPSLNPNLTDHLSSRPPRSRTADDYLDGIRAGDRVALSRAITLLESTRSDHRDTARTLVEQCLPHAGDSLRVAVTGVPGVGKSTFIETLGTHLVEESHRIAILAVDPSSERSGGSILGDKTRMGALASHDNVYIRPSPTGGSLGGVARTTRESIFLCEAAGFDLILVETVGVGQAEVKVHSMVDVFLLLALAGAGDELQGMKRGIVEMADLIAINKADGDNRNAAEEARAEYGTALRLLGEMASGWTPPVLTCSAEHDEGVREVWASIREYQTHTTESGFFREQRRRQARHWMYQAIDDALRDDFFSTPAVETARADIEDEVLRGERSSCAAAQTLLSIYRDALADQ